MYDREFVIGIGIAAFWIGFLGGVLYCYFIDRWVDKRIEKAKRDMKL